MDIEQKLNNPSKKVRLDALKDLVKTIDNKRIPILRKFIFLEKDKDLLFYARKSLDILSKDMKKEIQNIDINDHKFIDIMFNGDTPSKLDLLKNIIHLNRKKYINYLRDLVNKENDPFVLATIIRALGCLGDKIDITSIMPFLDHVDARIRSNTIESLSNLGGKDISHTIEPFLSDENPRVRITAANYLLTYYDEHDIDAIIQKMSQKDSLSEKAAVIFLIDKIKAPRFSGILLNLTKDKNKLIANQSAKALERLNKITTAIDVDELDILNRLVSQKSPLEKEINPELEKKPAADTFYRLLEELYSTKNPDKLKKTIIKLESLGDIRAIEPLKNLETDSKVVKYFLNRACEKLDNFNKKVFVCPNCGFHIRKEEDEMD
ncbi:MAG: hypothetical protein M0R46_08705 [Candidatus Muirbacterium halophilum]|nr:hypothetical protein [Candidatus Muirbacterium halophilum]MCK9475984.1 hypothetical protein [Candidatus Muirbacterium halophilum]